MLLHYLFLALLVVKGAVENFDDPEGKVKVTAAEWTKFTDKLEAGVEHELLMNVYNGWSKPIQIFSLSITLLDPQNLERQMRTLTPARLLVEVAPGEHFNIPFRFKPDRDLGRVGLDIQVDYTDKGKTKWHRVKGYLGVVEVIEKEETGKWQLLLACGCLLSVLVTPFLLRGKPKKAKHK